MVRRHRGLIGRETNTKHLPKADSDVRVARHQGYVIGVLRPDLPWRALRFYANRGVS